MVVSSRVREMVCMTAAKEYRRRKKDYVRSLERRIAIIENQKQKMTEELDITQSRSQTPRANNSRSVQWQRRV
ncbi:hypothetical protein Q8A67_024666 [Cirrhinus molitorella]|uniref:BZIP domain-containing protein n=1 Tax=Cirrhinus molitorella TaxID=172907 RepID=A0AA88TDP9_9TELE|nr:hypothetical protein Q8A67_024666 [Cirrhinus molitorella]